MNCAVCGTATSGPSICRSCDQIVGRGRSADAGNAYRASTARPDEDISSGVAVVWSAILLAITLGSAWVTVGRPTDSFTDGELFGNVAAHMLIAALIAGLLRWTAKVRYWRTFLITWAILIPLLFVASLNQRAENRRQDLHQALLDLKNATHSNNATTGSDSSTTGNAAASSDENAATPLQIAFQRIGENAMAFKQQEALRMQREKNLHMELVLQPQRLVSAQGIAQSRATLDQYRALLTERQTALKTLEDQNQAYLTQLPEPTQDAVLRGFLKSRIPADSAFDQYFTIENSTLDTFNQVLDVAQKALGRSRLDGNGKLMLPEPMHGQMINLWQTIQVETQEETAAKQTVRNMATQHQQDVDNLLKQTAAPGSSL